MMKSVERGNGTPESSSLASIFSLEVHTFKFYSMVDLNHPCQFYHVIYESNFYLIVGNKFSFHGYIAE